MTEKHCPDCGTKRPISEFGSNKSRPDGLTDYCRPHHTVRSARAGRRTYAKDPKKNIAKVRNWQKTQPEKHRHHQQRAKLLQRYGLTLEAYDELLKAADGKCAICQQPAKLCVDHDHATGQVRGMLCANCNHGLGKFRENIAALKAAIAYLEATPLLPPRRRAG